MKRLQPLALTVASGDECKLRCRPKFDEISEAEYADVMISIRAAAVDKAAEDSKIEAEFVFTFNEGGGVLQDQDFFHLTNDDYGELWINCSVDYFSLANENGIDVPGGKLRPHTLLVDEENNETTRRYKVVLSKDNDAEQKEYTFTVAGGPGNIRTISWMYGSYEASWSQKKWTFKSAPPADLEPLLISIIRMDEAINLELMPYAMR